ncbi:MAG TPA: universal stress protein [Chitinophaga sp.]|uniref:universal stress protein n=1 Tax=Chitinophaga sp. TaxID=1869181 RepID=UPI002B54B746|nr:universal stress protein [Chitinophaga sp.]HVI45078.1 universal stress protein [Chitinophaga sp.]
MKKIIAIIDPLNFSETQIAGFRYFMKEADSKLSVICLDCLNTEQVSMYSLVPEALAFNDERTITETRASLKHQRDHNISRLRELCDSRSINMIVREASSFPDEEVVMESRFADLLLISNGTSFSLMKDSNPTIFIKEVLARAECPVLVMPDTLAPIKEIIFSYNGSFSSMYAIKQFTQGFPGFADMPVKVVYIAEKNNIDIPWKKKLNEYLEMHYDRVEYVVMNGEPATEFLALLLHRTDCIVTYGAYGRSGISRFFHRSDAESVLRTTNIPVFITHP